MSDNRFVIFKKTYQTEKKGEGWGEKNDVFFFRKK